MKHRNIIILGVVAAVCASALTFILSRPDPELPPVRPGWRTGRMGYAAPPPLTPPGSAYPSSRRENGPAAPAPEHPRVAALAPAVAQILRDLGVGDLIVARHAQDRWTDPSVPPCGDQSGIDYERLLAVNPTHVLVQWGERELPDRLTGLAAERGWVVQNIPLLTLDDVQHATVALAGEIVTPELNALRAEDAAETPPPPAAPSPPPARAERERRLQAAPYTLIERLDRAYAADPSLARAGRVLLLYQGAGETGAAARPAALGPGSYSHDVLLRLGAQTATPTGKPFMPLDAEDVGALRPDAIVIVRPRATASAPRQGDGGTEATPGALTASLGAVARLDIPAVKNGRLALIDDPMALVPGTNLATFADRLREALKAWAGDPAR